MYESSDKCLENNQENDRQLDMKKAVLITAVSGIYACKGQQKIRLHIVEKQLRNLWNQNIKCNIKHTVTFCKQKCTSLWKVSAKYML